MALLMDFLGFLLASFGNDLTSHSLKVFLITLDENDFVSSLPNLINFVAKGIFTGLENNIVHRNTKPSNIFISNTRYSNKEATKREAVDCKISDLDEARSLMTQTCMVGNTSFLNDSNIFSWKYQTKVFRA